MDRRVRYEALQTDEDPDIDEPANQHVPDHVTVMMAEVPLVPQEGAMGGEDLEQPPPLPQEPVSEEAKFFEPPSYSVATSLPTYEEAERSKAEEAEVSEEAEREQQLQQQQYGLFAWNSQQKLELGTDGLFLCTFVVSFLFNWIGLLAAVCLSRTVAGRLGAVSGFGLSMVKWVAIVKHTDLGSGHLAGDSWLWWLLILLGFLIFFRGCTQYIRIKYQWQTLTEYVRQRGYLYF